MLTFREIIFSGFLKVEIDNMLENDAATFQKMAIVDTSDSYLKPQTWETEFGCPTGMPYMPSKHAFSALQVDVSVLTVPRMHALHA